MVERARMVVVRECENSQWKKQILTADSNHDELELALVVPLIAVIGVVTEPGALSIAVIGV